MSAWTEGLDPERQARIAARDRAAVYVPPSPAAIQDGARVAAASALWARDQAAAAVESGQGWETYGREMQARNARLKAEQGMADAAKRREQKAAEEESEKRRSRQQAEIRARATATAATVASIRAEIRKILES